MVADSPQHRNLGSKSTFSCQQAMVRCCLDCNFALIEVHPAAHMVKIHDPYGTIESEALTKLLELTWVSCLS